MAHDLTPAKKRGRSPRVALRQPALATAGGPAGSLLADRSGPVITILREAPLAAAAWLLYSLVRGLTDDRVASALTNAEGVMAFERRLGLLIEAPLHQAAVGNDLVIGMANVIYVAYWPMVFCALLWLVVRHRPTFRLYRNAMLASGGLALALFAFFPLAPPRKLPQHGFGDTIAVGYESYGEFIASALVNEYAAMPSLHFGWILLLAMALVSTTSNWVAKAAIGVVPALMFVAIVLTANHYVVDGIAGGAVALAGLAIARAFAVRNNDAQPNGARQRRAQASTISEW